MAGFSERIYYLPGNRGFTNLSPLSQMPAERITTIHMSDDLHSRIKAVMVEELMLQIQPEDISDDAPLFGPGGLGLDSVDALQLVIALEVTFKLKISEGDAARELLKSVQTIGDAIRALG